MANLARLLLMALLLFAGACSMDSAIERISSPEDRAFAQTFVADLRSGNLEKLKPGFDPKLWRESAAIIPTVGALFPTKPGTTRLIGYHIATNLAPGVSETNKEFVLVTTDGTRWTTTQIRTHASGGPATVIGWHVQPFDKPPPELAMFDQMAKLAPWLQAGALFLGLGMAFLIWWLVRRSRRRAAGA